LSALQSKRAARYMVLSSVSANELARICSESTSDEAWREFVRRFQRPIALAVLRTARCWGVQSAALLDDLVQETFLRLCADDCRLLKSFVPREPDSVIGYLKVVAANVTHDKLRADKTLKRGGSLNRQDSEPADLDAVFVASGEAEAMDKSIRRREIDRALQSFVPHVLTERDRTVFWLYFEQGFSAREIGAIGSIGLSVKGVESSIHRATQQVREALKPPRAANAAAEGISSPSAIYKEER
jgi:RNA polymerase sigma-70 factor (ECF subfamily)